MGYQVFAVSTDSPRRDATHRKKNDFPFLLLSDSKMSGARALGIAFHLDDPTRSAGIPGSTWRPPQGKPIMNFRYPPYS